MTGGIIDRTNGIIKGVSVITEGQAKGHGVLIDHKTLESIIEVASEFSSGVKVKSKHKDSTTHQNIITDTFGVLKDFRIDGKQVKADLHLLKSLPSDQKEKLFEMAEVMPGEFGLSIDFSGVGEEIGGQKYARCQELNSVDLCDSPAANPSGLFSENKTMSIKYKSGDSGEHHADCKCSDCGDEKMSKKMNALEAGFARLESALASLTKPAPVSSMKFSKDGKEVELTGAQIQAVLEQVQTLSTDTKAKADEAVRNTILSRMESEGRVPINPDTKVGYKLEELKALPLDILKFAAANAPVVPLQAHTTYKANGGKPSVDPALKGSAKVVAAWEQKYGDLNTMLSTPMTATV